MNDDDFDLEEDDSQESTSSGMDGIMGFIKNNMKLVIIVGVVLLFLIILSVASGGSSSGEKLTISDSTKVITTSAGAQLNLLTSDGKAVTGVKWVSSDVTIATVDDSGIVKGIRAGTVTITGTYNGKDYKCEVTVSEGDYSVRVESLKFPEGTILMPVGSTYEIMVEVTPGDAKLKNKLFASSNTNVATVDLTTGLITAKAVGMGKIRASVNDAEKLAAINIRVVDAQISPGVYIMPESITLSEKEVTLTEGETKAIAYTQLPEKASSDYILWVSADEEVVSVVNGELVAKKAGDVEVAVTSLGVKDIMVVHVKAGTVPVTSVSVSSSTSLTMNVGDREQIVAKVLPDNATNQVLTYGAENPTIVAVDSEGNVDAIGAGTTTIYIKSASDETIYKTVSVTVNDNTPYDPGTPSTPSDPGTPSTPSTPTETITVGTIKMVSSPDNAVQKTYSSSTNNKVSSATVDFEVDENVGEVRYCYYKYGAQDCEPNTIYLSAISLTNPGTYVIRAIPYYKGEKGTQITRYITIDSNGTTPTDPTDPTDPGTPSDPTTPTDPGTTVNTITVSSDPVGLQDTEQLAKSHAVVTTKVTVNLNGNDKVKYCYYKVGASHDNCNQNILYTSPFNFSRELGSTYIMEFTPYKGTTTGTVVKKYVYFNKEDVSTNKCYCTSSGYCKWGTSGSGYTIDAGVNSTECSKYINNGYTGCFLSKSTSKYTWGRFMGDPNNYAYTSGVYTSGDCSAKNGGSNPPADSTVGTISLSGTGLKTSKPSSSDTGVTGITVTVTKSGNVDKFKYCYTTSTDCTVSNETAIVGTSVKILSTLKTSGIYTLKVTPYYNGKAGTTVKRYFKITPAKSDPTCPTLTSYSGLYDGQGHTITVKGGSGGTIEYRKGQTGNWVTTLPSVTNEGVTVIYVRIKGDSTHNDKDCGSASVTLNPRPGQQTQQCNEGYYYNTSTSKCIVCPVGSYCRDSKKSTCPSGYYQTLPKGFNVSVVTESDLSSGKYKSYYPNSGNNYFVMLQTQGATSIEQCYMEVGKGYGLTFQGNSNAPAYFCYQGSYSEETRYVKYGASSGCTYCPKGYTTKYQGSTGIDKCTECAKGYHKDSLNRCVVD